MELPTNRKDCIQSRQPIKAYVNPMDIELFLVERIERNTGLTEQERLQISRDQKINDILNG